MTEEELREMCRSNYAAQMAGFGYGPDGMALPKKEKSGWVSVKDRLPELNQEVLVYAVGKADGFIGEHDIEICNRFIQRIFPSSQGQEIWSSPRQYFHTDYEITHWMPLPEPPEEKQ